MKLRAYLLLKKLVVFLGFVATRVASKGELISTITRFQPVRTNFTWVRAGSCFDGGYWVPKEIGEVDAIFSPGVGGSSDFELHYANLGIPCFMLDASVDSPPIFHEMFRFSKRFLGAKTAGETISLDDWLHESSLDKSTSLILQMDIEGSEYECLLGVGNQTLAAFKVIAIELHKLDLFMSRSGLVVLNSFLDRLQFHHSIAFLQANNSTKPFRTKGVVVPSVIELVLVRNDLIAEIHDEKSSEQSMNVSSNLPSKKPVFLPDYWTGQVNEKRGK
jgi:hypothetical protein